MKILGINKGLSSFGKPLRDGGAAIYIDGQITVLSEARITGIKYAGGYESALGNLAARYEIRPESDFDCIAISTCCEPESAAVNGHYLSGHPSLITVGHHLSHASLAYYASGYPDALVVVADGGGNTLSTENQASQNFWEQPREQFSFYAGSHGRLELLGRDFAQPYEAGLAELYRDFTYFLGWHSYVHASKIMALAALGIPSAIPGEPFVLDNGALKASVHNSPYEPIAMVSRLGHALGIDFGPPRTPGTNITKHHQNIAAFIQQGIESALYKKLHYLVKETGLRNACLTGGLALNIVANTRIRSLFPGGVYVPSAPGDDGQCVGNVFAALAALEITSPIHKKSSDVYLGPPNTPGSAMIASSLITAGLKNAIVVETTKPEAKLAELLEAGHIVAIYDKRSELGPRALGARSIFADPRRPEVVQTLNTAKQRERFMPFAPMIHEDDVPRFFTGNAESPFMSFALYTSGQVEDCIPAVVHVDGSARVQVISQDETSPAATLLRKFGELTNVPILLNTSFNLGGHPIVETVKQAVQTFSQMPISAMLIGRFVVVKPDCWHNSPSFYNASLAKPNSSREYTISVDGAPVSSLEIISEITSSVIFVRDTLPLYTPYLKQLISGKKKTSIRFRRGGIEIPAQAVIPLIDNPDFKAREVQRDAGLVKISSVRYQQFRSLTYEDAKNDGFDSLSDMRQSLKEIYSCISDNDWVTIYDIKLNHESSLAKNPSIE